MPKSILIIDDDPGVRAVLKTKMEGEGYLVEETEDGREAIRKLTDRVFDLVIADILLPELDGLEVIMHLRRTQNPAKVIAISGQGNDLFLANASGLGASRVFSKPLDLSAIAHTTAALLSD